MDYIVSASTDIGIKKQTNQDSLTVKVINSPSGRMTLAVLCDGMGGLSDGEIASASVIKAFEKWLDNKLSNPAEGDFDLKLVSKEWNDLVVGMNQKIMQYGKVKGINLGTTVTAMLIKQDQYIVLNVGDTRAYEIYDSLYQITNDHTLIAKEIAEGRLSVQEAETDPRRSVLLQCCGASAEVIPEFHYGYPNKNALYLLCSDGFRHQISPEEIFYTFDPSRMCDESVMKKSIDDLIELNKQRMESDNISAILIRTL